MDVSQIPSFNPSQFNNINSTAGAAGAGAIQTELASIVGSLTQLQNIAQQPQAQSGQISPATQAQVQAALTNIAKQLQLLQQQGALGGQSQGATGTQQSSATQVPPAVQAFLAQLAQLLQQLGVKPPQQAAPQQQQNTLLAATGFPKNDAFTAQNAVAAQKVDPTTQVAPATNNVVNV